VFKLYNGSQQLVLTQNLTGTTTTIPRGSLPNGTYNWVISDPAGTQFYGSGTLILQ